MCSDSISWSVFFYNNKLAFSLSEKKKKKMLKIYMFNQLFRKYWPWRKYGRQSLAMLDSPCKPSAHLSGELKSNWEDSETSFVNNVDVIIQMIPAWQYLCMYRIAGWELQHPARQFGLFMIIVISFPFPPCSLAYFVNSDAIHFIAKRKPDNS